MIDWYNLKDIYDISRACREVMDRISPFTARASVYGYMPKGFKEQAHLFSGRLGIEKTIFDANNNDPKLYNTFVEMKLGAMGRMFSAACIRGDHGFPPLRRMTDPKSSYLSISRENMDRFDDAGRELIGRNDVLYFPNPVEVYLSNFMVHRFDDADFMGFEISATVWRPE